MMSVINYIAWVQAIKNTEYAKSEEVIIQSSCRSNEVCYDGSNGGVFTGSYRNRCIMSVPKEQGGLYWTAGITAIVLSLPVMLVKDGIIGNLYNSATKKFTPDKSSGYVDIGEHDGYTLEFRSFKGWNRMNIEQTVIGIGKVCTFGQVGNK